MYMSNFNLIRSLNLEEIDCNKWTNRYKSDSIKVPFFCAKLSKLPYFPAYNPQTIFLALSKKFPQIIGGGVLSADKNHYQHTDARITTALLIEHNGKIK